MCRYRRQGIALAQYNQSSVHATACVQWSGHKDEHHILACRSSAPDVVTSCKLLQSAFAAQLRAALPVLLTAWWVCSHRPDAGADDG